MSIEIPCAVHDSPTHRDLRGGIATPSRLPGRGGSRASGRPWTARTDSGPASSPGPQPEMIGWGSSSAGSFLSRGLRSPTCKKSSAWKAGSMPGAFHRHLGLRNQVRLPREPTPLGLQALSETRNGPGGGCRLGIRHLAAALRIPGIGFLNEVYPSCSILEICNVLLPYIVVDSSSWLTILSGVPRQADFAE